MKDVEGLGRRRFVATAGKAALGFGLTLAAPVPSFGRQRAGTPVRLGMIGFGVRGTELARTLGTGAGAQITAVADLYTGHRRRVLELLGSTVATTVDYREILDRRDIDAVVVATPDHWHVPITLQALDAGKDVYCESPVIHTPDEGSKLLNASKGRVVQIGSGLISSPLFSSVRQMIVDGRLGRVTVVQARWDTGSALDAWQRPFPPDASPDTIAFTRFLGASQPREFDLHRFFRWPCYWDYGSGLAGARFVPLLTAIHWLVGSNAPARASLGGGRWRWKDGREVPDALFGTFDYEEGLTVTLAATQNGGSGREIRFIGTDATLLLTEEGATVLPGRQAEPYRPLAESWPQEYRDWFYMMHGMSPQGEVRRQFPAERIRERYEVPNRRDPLAAHLANFIECVRSRAEPQEPLALGLQAAEVVARAVQRFRERDRNSADR